MTVVFCLHIIFDAKNAFIWIIFFASVKRICIFWHWSHPNSLKRSKNVHRIPICLTSCFFYSFLHENKYFFFSFVAKINKHFTLRILYVFARLFLKIQFLHSFLFYHFLLTWDKVHLHLYRQFFFFFGFFQFQIKSLQSLKHQTI